MRPEAHEVRSAPLVRASERDRSETTRDRMKCGAGDVADSPTRRSKPTSGEATPWKRAMKRLAQKISIYYQRSKKVVLSSPCDLRGKVISSLT